jgi:hypothetical protein
MPQLPMLPGAEVVKVVKPLEKAISRCSYDRSAESIGSRMPAPSGVGSACVAEPLTATLHADRRRPIERAGTSNGPGQTW